MPLQRWPSSEEVSLRRCNASQYLPWARTMSRDLWGESVCQRRLEACWYTARNIPSGTPDKPLPPQKLWLGSGGTEFREFRDRGIGVTFRTQKPIHSQSVG